MIKERGEKLQNINYSIIVLLIHYLIDKAYTNVMYAEHNDVTEKISTLKYITDIYEITVLLIAKAGPPSTDIRFIENLG